MEIGEQEKYNTLTDFQKSVVDALKNIGFTYKWGNIYSCRGFNDINVGKIENIENLIYHFHNDGKDQKRFEILNVLGL